jgi:hypothetical protein
MLTWAPIMGSCSSGAPCESATLRAESASWLASTLELSSHSSLMAAAFMAGCVSGDGPARCNDF